MPVRSNPYLGSADTYGSRNLTPTYIPRSDSLALPLAQLASGILDAATYKPENDPRLLAAQADRLKIMNDRDKNIAMGQERSMLSDQTIPLGDIAAHAMGYGHMSPEDAAKVALVAQAARGAPEGVNMDDFLTASAPWELAAGRSGSATFPANTYATRKKPTEVRTDAGGVELVPAEDTTGRVPVLEESKVKGNMLGDLAASLTPEQQRQVVGANPTQRTPYNYIRSDGTQGSTLDPGSVAGPGTSIYTGQVQGTTPGSLTTPVKTDVQKADLAQKGFGDLLSMTREVAKKSPTLFGVTGNVRRIGQEVVQQLQNSKLMGANDNVDTAFSQVLDKAKQNGIVIPGLDHYDPALSDIVKLSTILTYNAAEVFANQQGRSVSDKDVTKFQKLVGNPESFLSSQQQFLSGLDLMENVLNLKQARTDAVLGRTPAAPAPSAPAASPAPAAQPTPAEVPEGATATNEATGKRLVRRNGKWVPAN